MPATITYRGVVRHPAPFVVCFNMVPYFACHAFGATGYSQRVDARNPFADPGLEPGTDSSTYPSRTVESTSVNLSPLLLFTILKHTQTELNRPFRPSPEL